MNRIQFFVLIGLSSLLFLVLVINVLLSHKVAYQQGQMAQAQQALTQGQTLQQNLRQLALRLYSDSQKTGDQGLKDILARQQISFKSNDTGSTNATDMPAAPSSSSTH